jgi:hypothetical protein
MSTQEKAIIATAERSRATFEEAADVVKRSASPEAHAAIDAMVRAHGSLCALVTALVRT